VTLPDWLAPQHGLNVDELQDHTDPDGAAERERAREEQADQERAERRKLIALNKLGEDAEAVRRTGCATTCSHVLLTALVGAPHRWH
jgi:ParB family chromosome partitioning protein